MNYPREGNCSLCEGKYERWGNNPSPLLIFELRCCDVCNLTKVIPARMGYKIPAPRVCATCGETFTPAAEELVDCPKCWKKATKEVKVEEKPKPKKPQSRSARWGDAVGNAISALDGIESLINDFESAAEELKSVQEEYAEWKDNLPENLSSSALGEKLEAVCDLDIESAAQTIRDAVEEARGTFDEAEGLDLPQGFGRD